MTRKQLREKLPEYIYMMEIAPSKRVRSHYNNLYNSVCDQLSQIGSKWYPLNKSTQQ